MPAVVLHDNSLWKFVPYVHCDMFYFFNKIFHICQMADFLKEIKYVTLDSTLVYKH